MKICNWKSYFACAYTEFISALSTFMDPAAWNLV